MRSFLATLALGFIAAFPAVGSGGLIEDVIDLEMPASGVPGLAYAVVTDGEITSVGARGVARRGEDTKVTPDTIFVAGSISTELNETERQAQEPLKLRASSGVGPGTGR